MKKRTIFIRFASFLLIFLILFTVVTEVLKDKRVELEYDVTAKVKGFYAEPENSLDFVFVGSSQMYADIAPNVLFSEYGITSYDFCANEQPLWISYYYIKEALKHQNPKAIILDVFTVYGADYEAEGVNHINLDDLPWSLNKIRAIQEAVPGGERGAFYFELVKYHDTWNTLSESKIKNSFYDEKNPYKGYSPFVVVHEYADSAPADVVNQTEKEPLPEKAMYWLEKIVELTRKEEVDLILIKTPNGNAERQKLYNSVAEFAGERQVPFLNLNTIFDGEAHINVLQAEKVTSYVGEYLTDIYEIEDKRENPAYARWHEDSEWFYHKKDKCIQIGIHDLQTYFETLQDTEWVTLFALKKEEAITLTGEQKEALTNLGITPDYEQEGDWCYLTLIQNGTAFTDGVQTGENYSQDIPFGEHVFTLSYEITEDGEKKTGLLLDGDNYSLDYSGINVFSYDLLLDEIVEFVAFDGAEGYTAKRE